MENFEIQRIIGGVDNPSRGDSYRTSEDFNARTNRVKFEDKNSRMLLKEDGTDLAWQAKPRKIFLWWGNNLDAFMLEELGFKFRSGEALNDDAFNAIFSRFNYPKEDENAKSRAPKLFQLDDLFIQTSKANFPVDKDNFFFLGFNWKEDDSGKQYFSELEVDDIDENLHRVVLARDSFIKFSVDDTLEVSRPYSSLSNFQLFYGSGESARCLSDPTEENCFEIIAPEQESFKREINIVVQTFLAQHKAGLNLINLKNEHRDQVVDSFWTAFDTITTEVIITLDDLLEALKDYILFTYKTTPELGDLIRYLNNHFSELVDLLEPQKFKITPLEDSDSTSIRSHPSRRNSEQVDERIRGEVEFIVLDKETQRDWMKVIHEEKTGWVQFRRLDPDPRE